MKKFFLLASALVSFSAFAEEQCLIKLSAKDSKWFETQYDAQKHCDAYKQIGCKVTNPESGRWNALIDFNEVFKNVNEDNDFKAARKEAYKLYFSALETRGIYRMPLAFSLSFDCKAKY